MPHLDTSELRAAIFARVNQWFTDVDTGALGAMPCGTDADCQQKASENLTSAILETVCACVSPITATAVPSTVPLDAYAGR